MNILAWHGIRWFLCANAFVAMWVAGFLAMGTLFEFCEWWLALYQIGVNTLHELLMPDTFDGECNEYCVIWTMLWLWVPPAAGYTWWFNRWLKRRVHLSVEE